MFRLWELQKTEQFVTQCPVFASDHPVRFGGEHPESFEQRFEPGMVDFADFIDLIQAAGVENRRQQRAV